MSSAIPSPTNERNRNGDKSKTAENAVLNGEFETIHGKRINGSLDDYYQAVHDVDDGQCALCLSGGGIRSAAFALGILHGLAECGVLRKFHYLSTVSGGGYMGSWLTAWRTRSGLAAVLDGVSQIGKAAAPDALSNLRGGSTYLSPKAGLFSGDTWTDIVLIFRNLLLVNLLIVPLFAALLLLGKSMFSIDHPLSASPGEGAYRVAPLLLTVSGWIVLAQRRPSWARRVDGKVATKGCERLQVLLPGVAIGLFWLASLSFAFTVDQRPNSATPDAAFDSMATLANAVPIIKTCAAAGVITAFLALVLSFFSDCSRSDPDSQGNVAREIPIAWVCISLQLAIAGAVAGLLISSWLTLAPKLHAVFPEQKVFFAVKLCVSPVVFALAIITAENIYLGLGTWRPRPRPPKKWNDRWGDEEREWVARTYGYFLLCVVATCAFLFVSIFSTSVLHAIFSGGSYAGAKKIFAGLVALSSGLAALGLGASSLSKGNGTSATNRRIPIRLILIIATPIFGLLLLMGLSAGLDLLLWRQDALDVLDKGWSWQLLLAAVALVAMSLALSSRININRYSLHDLYRNRLTREFLGASNLGRKGDPWTGFDASDDVELKCCASPVLYPVINATLNALHQTRLQLLHRQAYSFVFTPLYCGSGRTGYRPTEQYADSMRLGAAMAISGAAVSPNAGYCTMKGLSLLLTVFNLRLGVWAGNPGHPDSWKTRGPKLSLRPLVSEAFSRTSATAKYVYLSDGGHFDNLGLFEMLKRRCKYIVVSDASADSDFEFEDLGRAVRRALLDLNVQIAFPAGFDLGKRRDTPFSGPYSAIADITYPEINPASGERYTGKLLYIKAGYHGKGEPMDVRAFAASNPKFPHDPTSNQFFDENYFESYRSLGHHIIRDMYGVDSTPSSLRAFFGICEIMAQCRNRTAA